jgi:hypothetical protein
VHGRDAEIVPLPTVEVQNDGSEAERLGDSARDQRQNGVQIALAADELRDSDEGTDTRELL